MSQEFQFVLFNSICINMVDISKNECYIRVIRNKLLTSENYYEQYKTNPNAGIY